MSPKGESHSATTLVIVAGAPGSGKTHYGRRLARTRKCVFLDIDTCTETVIHAALTSMDRDPDDRDSPFFKTRFREPIYETLFAIATENLAWQDAIIAGPFTKEIANPNWLTTLRERFRANVEVHFIHCPPDIRKERIAARGNPRDASKQQDWENHQSYYGAQSPPPFEHTFVDSTKPD